MSLNHSKLTLSAGAHTLVSDPASDNDMYNRDLTISIQNLHSTHYVYVGSQEVTSTSYGYRISPGDSFAISNLRPDEELYATTDTGSTDIAVIKVKH
jgi:hypothetical protein